jgi:hypothetical protein
LTSRRRQLISVLPVGTVLALRDAAPWDTCQLLVCGGAHHGFAAIGQFGVGASWLRDNLIAKFFDVFRIRS